MYCCLFFHSCCLDIVTDSLNHYNNSSKLHIISQVKITQYFILFSRADLFTFSYFIFFLIIGRVGVSTGVRSCRPVSLRGLLGFLEVVGAFRRRLVPTRSWSLVGRIDSGFRFVGLSRPILRLVFWNLLLLWSLPILSRVRFHGWTMV